MKSSVASFQRHLEPRKIDGLSWTLPIMTSAMCLKFSGLSSFTISEIRDDRSMLWILSKPKNSQYKYPCSGLLSVVDTATQDDWKEILDFAINEIVLDLLLNENLRVYAFWRKIPELGSSISSLAFLPLRNLLPFLHLFLSISNAIFCYQVFFL